MDCTLHLLTISDTAVAPLSVFVMLMLIHLIIEHIESSLLKRLLLVILITTISVMPIVKVKNGLLIGNILQTFTTVESGEKLLCFTFPGSLPSHGYASFLTL